ncbi:hypothetical protein JXA32_00730 [Candidatus Sumerlaeota bacterium]|nr:hypothetical protein [Candidatus Sumerlaeota bacterium]
MKTDQTHTFCLIPESYSEYQQWKTLLALSCWAEGEFGIILTESAFRQITKESTDDMSIPREIRSRLFTLAAVVEVGDYTDVCLQHTAASAGHAD